MPKISRRWFSFTFLVSFSMTILALRGTDGLRDLERERILLLKRSREGVREGERLRRVPLRRSSLCERERDRESARSGGGALPGVVDRPRETLRCGGDDMLLAWSKMVFCYCGMLI